MDYFFIYNSNATYDEVWQYLANLGLKKFFSERRKNPSYPDEVLVYDDDFEEEDPQVLKKLLAIMLRQARALGWDIPKTWDPYDTRGRLPAILLNLTAQELKSLLQNQVKLLIGIVKENNFYGMCERLDKVSWEDNPQIRVPMRIMEQKDGALYWGIPTLYLWVPATNSNKGYKKYFVYDEASGKRVFIKTKKGKPSCYPRTKVWSFPQEDLRSFVTTKHYWPVPFIPRRWRTTKPEKWLADLVGEEVDGVAHTGVFSVPIEAHHSFKPIGGAYLEFSEPEKLESADSIEIIAKDILATASSSDQSVILNPEISSHDLPGGVEPLVELALTQDGDAFQWQQLALDAWWNSEGGTAENPWTGGLVEACTGAGKTKFCLSAIDRVLDDVENLGSSVRVSIIFPTKSLLMQWYDEVHERFNDKVSGISRHGSGFSEPAGQLSLWIINTASKEFPIMEAQHPHLSNYEYHFLIVDEVHRSTSRTFRRIYEDEAQYKLGVTATLPGKGESPNSPGVRKFKLLYKNVGPVVCQYRYPQALMKGNISKFTLTYLETEFTQGEKEAYDALTEKIEKLAPAVNEQRKAGKLFPEGYDSESYSKLSEDQKDDVGDAPLLRVLKFLGASRSRIDWCAAKRMACAVDLIRQKLDEGKKIIVFHKSIHGAMALYNILTMGYGYGEPGTSSYPLISPNSEIGLYHSGNPHHVNDNFLEAFRRENHDKGHKIRCLLSVESLLEGLDVPSADVGISVAATKSEIKAVQSLGRVLRVKRDASGQPIEEGKEFYLIRLLGSRGDDSLKIKFENSLVDEDGRFITNELGPDGRPPVINCNYHHPEEVDYMHNRSGLFNYEQLHRLASTVGDHDLLTRSQLVNFIEKDRDSKLLNLATRVIGDSGDFESMERSRIINLILKEKVKSREEAAEAKEPYDDSVITGAGWYKIPAVSYPSWAEEKPQNNRRNKRRRNPNR